MEGQIDDWQLKIIAKFHPEEETKKDAGMKLVDHYYSENRKDILLHIAENKNYHIDVQKAAGFKLIEIAEDSYTELIHLSQRNVHFSVYEKAQSKVESAAMKWINACLEKKEYWNLASTYESQSFPPSLRPKLHEILREKAMEFSGMDKESRDKYDATVKGKKGEEKKVKGRVANR